MHLVRFRDQNRKPTSGAKAARAAAGESMPLAIYRTRRTTDAIAWWLTVDFGIRLLTG